LTKNTHPEAQRATMQYQSSLFSNWATTKESSKESINQSITQADTLQLTSIDRILDDDVIVTWPWYAAVPQSGRSTNHSKVLHVSASTTQHAAVLTQVSVKCLHISDAVSW